MHIIEHKSLVFQNNHSKNKNEYFDANYFKHYEVLLIRIKVFMIKRKY
jgi:hypothetical protein